MLPGRPDELVGLGGGAAMILLYALMIYLVPYLVVAIPLWIRAPRMGRESVVLALRLLPALVTVLTALGVLLVEFIARRRFVAASTVEILGLGLLFGYSYAALGWPYLRSRWS